MNDLSEIIRREIAGHGCISFARFMEMALYHPEFGYYERHLDQIGRQGDFYTSVAVGSLFGELLSFQFAEWLAQIEQQPLSDSGETAQAQAASDRSSRLEEAHFSAESPNQILSSDKVNRLQIVEAGAHDGRLTLDMLRWFQHCRPELLHKFDYWIIEPSARRRQCQEKTLEAFAGRVRWFASWDSFTPQFVQGVIFANELLDAFPVHRIGWDATRQSWFEWGVAWNGRDFEWLRMTDMQHDGCDLTKELDWPKLPPELLAVLPDGFTTEVSPVAGAWWHQAAATLGRGKLLTVDYGLTAERFFLPERIEGTLRGYRKHHAGSNLLDQVGEQDLTAQVNFTALQRVGEKAGLSTEPLISQAEFLTRIAERTWTPNSRFGPWSPEQKRQFQTLVHPNHLGRAFQVLIQSR